MLVAKVNGGLIESQTGSVGTEAGRTERSIRTNQTISIFIRLRLPKYHYAFVARDVVQTTNSHEWAISI